MRTEPKTMNALLVDAKGERRLKLATSWQVTGGRVTEVVTGHAVRVTSAVQP